MSGISGAFWRREQDTMRPHKYSTERTPERPQGLTPLGAPLERRVAFAEGAQALRTPPATTMIPRLSRTAPLRGLPRTAALAPGGYAASVAGIASAGARTSPQAPRNLTGARPLDLTRRGLWYQAAIYVALNLGDVVSTYVGLEHGLSEGNPMMRALLIHDGFAALIVYKVLITLVVLMGLWLLGAWSIRAARVALLVCNTVVALVVLLNVAQFALLGR